MKNPLVDIFGHCIIPKNILLYRAHSKETFSNCMFFATYLYATIDSTLVHGDTIQIWETTSEIQVLFLIEYVDDDGATISALPRLHNIVFPLESEFEFSAMDIKRDIDRRDRLVKTVYDDYGVVGWFSSIHDKLDLELCLFDEKTNTKLLRLIDIVDSNNKTYFKNSLKEIKVLPSLDFFNRTRTQLEERAQGRSIDEVSYDGFNEQVKSWIETEVKNGDSPIEAEHFHFYLRNKLGI